MSHDQITTRLSQFQRTSLPFTLVTRDGRCPCDWWGCRHVGVTLGRSMREASAGGYQTCSSDASHCDVTRLPADAVGDLAPGVSAVFDVRVVRAAGQRVGRANRAAHRDRDAHRRWDGGSGVVSLGVSIVLALRLRGKAPALAPPVARFRLEAQASDRASAADRRRPGRLEQHGPADRTR
jgi:hypothetical protein